MSKFISIPLGVQNAETKQMERSEIIVNQDNIVRIAPEGEFMCRIQLTGGTIIKAYRRYDTLKAQIMRLGEVDTSEDTIHNEEVDAAYADGYAAAIKSTLPPEDVMEKYRKKFIAVAMEWLTTNPLCDGWMGRFKKALKHADLDADGVVINDTEDKI